MKIGLMLGYELLSALGHPVGVAFQRNKELGDRLKERNASILAHGTNPISQRLCNRLFSDVLDFLQLEMPDFEEHAKGAQFPWFISG